MQAVPRSTHCTPTRRSLRTATAFLAYAAVLGSSGVVSSPAFGQVAMVLRNGPPLQVRPYVNEPGVPSFEVQPGTANPFTGADGSTDDNSGGSDSSGDGTTSSDGSGGGSSGGGDTLATMIGTPWGAQAISNAQTLGVNPTALAATCLMESGCNANTGASGTISGAFQMRDDTFRAMADEAIARNPSLASQILPGLASKNDPAAQAIASSQYLYDGAVKLQAAGVPDPTFAEVRPMFQFGLSGGLRLGTADDSTLLSSQVSLTPAQWAANQLDPATATVGQYRQMTANKVGAAANASVLSR